MVLCTPSDTGHEKIGDYSHDVIPCWITAVDQLHTNHFLSPVIPTSITLSGKSIYIKELLIRTSFSFLTMVPVLATPTI